MSRGFGFKLALAFALFGSAGCASVPPVPVDQFYRLPDPPIAGRPLDPGELGEVVLVLPFRSAGLHRERAIVYSEDARAVSFKRYHYHLWIDSPPKLLQEYLAARMRAVAPAVLVLTEERDGGADLVIEGMVRRFEQHVPDGAEASALVGLELRASRAREPRPLLVRDYTARIRIEGDSMASVVDAFGTAVEQVVAAFLGDLRDGLARAD